jgi:hypothetical protein
MSKKFETLKDLESEVEMIKEELVKHTNLRSLMYRGQSNAEWNLQTALERSSKHAYSVKEYDAVLQKISSQIQVFTNKSWDLSKKYAEPDQGGKFVPPNLEFMAYARHYGFPTPILDWTHSFYVALFFAFQYAEEEKEVALYLNLNMGRVLAIKPFDSFDSSEATVNTLEVDSPTDKRHFIQQALYTVCTKNVDGVIIYCDHDDVFNDEKNEIDRRFVMQKCILPGSLKKSVLARLNEMNINEYTLYGDEASLLSMLARKEIV